MLHIHSLSTTKPTNLILSHLSERCYCLYYRFQEAITPPHYILHARTTKKSHNERTRLHHLSLYGISSPCDHRLTANNGQPIHSQLQRCTKITKYSVVNHQINPQMSLKVSGNDILLYTAPHFASEIIICCNYRYIKRNRFMIANFP